jgi:uncharacterized protein YdbL (DUF1318 family)
MTRAAILLVALLAPPAAAIAQTAAVDAARSAGVVGERFDGYIGFASAPSETVRAQVSAINIRRRALYSNLAARKGASPGEVGVTAACQLLGRVPVGGAYMLGDGVWRRRAAGQPAPVPDYCGR